MRNCFCGRVRIDTVNDSIDAITIVKEMPLLTKNYEKKSAQVVEVIKIGNMSSSMKE